MVGHDIAKRILTDPEVFGEVIDEYEEKLLRYILRITDIGYEDAENLLQEVFIKVYRNINEYDESLSFSSWIYRIAHNLAIDNYRKYEKAPKNISIDDEEYENIIRSLTDGENPHDDLKSKDMRECVSRCIKELPSEYREILILRYMEEYSYEEISDILKMPVGTVGTNVSRAKSRLRDLLTKNRCTFNI